MLFSRRKTPASPVVASSEGVAKLSPGLTQIKDIIAPDALEVDFSFLKIGDVYLRTLFISGYPRFVNANWLSPLINFDRSLDISMHIYPVEGKSILDELQRKITEMEAELRSDLSHGKIANVETEVKLQDAKSLQEQLVKGAERFFQFALYITVSARSLEELNTITQQVQSTLGSLLIIAKSASLQMEDAFKTTLPLGVDKLYITRNMDTTSLATTFPFISSELTSAQGILYGINEHNDSLVIFDRFSLENANMVVFAKSGAGKSYFVKLEALRSLMFDTEVIVIDPENEYQSLCDAVAGEFIPLSFSSPARINPFDLSSVYEAGTDELSQKILSLHSLLKIMLGNITPSQEALLDRSLVATYKAKGITPDPATQKYDPPLLKDLLQTLSSSPDKDAKDLAARLEKFVTGSFQSIFNQPTNVNLNHPFTVFSIRDLQDELRPTAMFIILDFIWTKIRRDLKKRLLIVDEAWYLMKYPDTANFLYSFAKRARKYYLGLTTITQDVEDFLATDHGKAIVTNSSLQFLMKQSTAAIDQIAKVFYLSQGERHLLLAADIGEGLFFAGQNHVALKVVASPQEHQLITSKPQEVTKPNPAPTAAPVATGAKGGRPAFVVEEVSSPSSLTL